MGKSKETINDRVKKIRKELGFTQEEFAKKIFVSHGQISAMELKRSIVNDQNISLICTSNRFKNGVTVNETWLRTGKGEMFNKKPEPVKTTIIGPDGETLIGDEAELLEIYRELEEPTQEKVLTYAHDMLDAQKHQAGAKLERGENIKIGPGDSGETG
jgi:transcriptional regulator with XRE-family HTH domain